MPFISFPPPTRFGSLEVNRFYLSYFSSSFSSSQSWQAQNPVSPGSWPQRRNMPDPWQNLLDARTMSETCQKHVRNMAELCQNYVRHICQNYARHMPEPWPNYVRDMPEFYANKYARTMSEVGQKHARHLPY